MKISSWETKLAERTHTKIWIQWESPQFGFLESILEVLSRNSYDFERIECFEATVNRVNHRLEEIISLMHQEVGGGSLG